MASRRSSRHSGPRRSALRAAAATALSMMLGYAQAQEPSPAGPVMDGIAWDCSGWHTVVSGDLCWQIWQTYGITEAQFLTWNPAVTSGCASNFWPDYSYCVRVSQAGIPSNCDTWHRVGSGDTCWQIWQTYGITETEFLEWNPAVTSGCGSGFWPDYSYCVGVDENQPSRPSSSSSSSSSFAVSSTSSRSSSSSRISSTPTSVNTTTTPYSTRYPVTSYNLTKPYTATALPPQRTLGGQPTYCNAWHQVGAGQTCDDVVNTYSNRLTFPQLLEYNPTIGEDCGGLYIGWYICVGIQSQSSSRIEWYTQQTNFTSPIATPYPGYVATVVANFTALPQQTGIPAACQNYHQAADGDTCRSVLAVYDYITESQFFAWNPALNKNCDGLWVGYYYCVAAFASPEDLPMPPTLTTPGSPSGTGTISTCQKWYLTKNANDDCQSIALWFGTFSVDEFISWNPSVRSTCANIKPDTYYCVGVPGTPTTRSVAITPTLAPTFPTQTGLAANCTQFWLVSPDDTCATIIRDSGSTSTNFYAWNPAIGTDCAGLLADYFVCVSTDEKEEIPPVSTVTISDGQTIIPRSSSTASVSSSTTAPASTPVTTPTPYMPGMVDDCVRFYFRGESDLFCYDIAQYAGIELSEFVAWNPQVGSDCGGLWADTWYCIGLAGATPTTISFGVPTPA
ncbi:hypothetical protein B0H66DRAFT_594234 [Apodospora peruviana]|uniref:LysM domain-containing protein n=1 Tax=Apodospora peruviana TaxID=516989 RepID=A0AAE0HV52_9PEZI|nr:hypothetical protein B0H66DRAFT_594234 [Apodospora peruviana]